MLFDYESHNLYNFDLFVFQNGFRDFPLMKLSNL